MVNLYQTPNHTVPEQSQENPVLKLGPSPTGQILYFFGARHTNNPDDIQFNYLQQFWNEFLNVVKRDKIIFIEGATREISQNYEEAIRQYGEAGAIRWLARESNIDVIRPEPGEEEQRKLLCALFSHHIVAYTVIAQNLAGWFRHKSQTSFDKAVERVLEREAKFSNIYGFIPDRLWLDNQHKELFGERRLEDKNFLDSISDPRKGGTMVNNIVAFRSKMRDEHLLSAIVKAWKSGKSIFIVYGRGHLLSMERSLQELVKS